MGVVLKAYDPSLHRVVAVKVLASHLAHHAVARKRFIWEAQVAVVCHDNVVTIHAIEDGVADASRIGLPTRDNFGDVSDSKIEEARAEVGWKPIDLAPALRLLDQSEFAPDPITTPFLNPVLTMPIPKAVASQ